MGDSWQAIFDDQPSLSIGALAIDPEDPDVIYVGTGEVNGGGGSLTYGGTGIYKSDDAGLSWTSLGLTETRHIGRIVIDPSNPQRIFVAAMGRLFSENEERGLYRSEDGGITFEDVSDGMHVDHHGLYIHPLNTNLIIDGNDGGFYISRDGGNTWEHKDNLPITQFYTVDIDFQNPLHVAGGTQDNNTHHTFSSAQSEWDVLLPIGDGQYVRFDPNDDQKVYGSFQRGSIMRSVDGGENFIFATEGIDAEEPVNWSAPIELDVSNPGTLYTGTNRVYRFCCVYYCSL